MATRASAAQSRTRTPSLPAPSPLPPSSPHHTHTHAHAHAHEKAIGDSRARSVVLKGCRLEVDGERDYLVKLVEDAVPGERSAVKADGDRLAGRPTCRVDPRLPPAHRFVEHDLEPFTQAVLHAWCVEARRAVGFVLNVVHPQVGDAVALPHAPEPGNQLWLAVPLPFVEAAHVHRRAPFLASRQFAREFVEEEPRVERRHQGLDLAEDLFNRLTCVCSTRPHVVGCVQHHRRR